MHINLQIKASIFTTLKLTWSTLCNTDSAEPLEPALSRSPGEYLHLTEKALRSPSDSWQPTYQHCCLAMRTGRQAVALSNHGRWRRAHRKQPTPDTCCCEHSCWPNTRLNTAASQHFSKMEERERARVLRGTLVNSESCLLTMLLLFLLAKYRVLHLLFCFRSQ